MDVFSPNSNMNTDFCKSSKKNNDVCFMYIDGPDNECCGIRVNAGYTKCKKKVHGNNKLCHIHKNQKIAFLKN